MTGPARLRIAAAVVALAAGLAACSSSAASVGPVGPPAASVPVPESLANLSLVAEDEATEAFSQAIATVEEDEAVESYVSDAVVYALRDGDELKGVLEIGRLRGDARPQEADWRRTIAQQVGRGDVESPEKIDDILVYEREGNQQQIFLWFVDHTMFVLILRQDETIEGEGLGFDPASVLRDAVGIRPPASTPA